MIKLVENQITIEEYMYLRDKVNWKKLSMNQSESALKHSLFVVKAVDSNGDVIGMGRIVGDGAVI